MSERYEILDEIGSGGQAVVYRARDQHLGREVAIKQPLSKVHFHDTEARHEFEQEAKILAQLDEHPAIVRVHDFGIGARGPYIVMRFVEGKNLREYLERHGPLPPTETARLGRRLADALSHAHDEGVLHRDLKPKNVLVEDGDLEKALLADFGMAYLLERTTTAEQEGTPAYMSPEQLSPEELREEGLDERSDIYGLGAVLYECVSGAPPYGRGRMFQVLYRILNEEREQLGDVEKVPSWLAEVIEKCLTREPGGRYQRAKGVEEALQRVEGAKGGMSARPPTVKMSSPKENPSRLPESGREQVENWPDVLIPLKEAMRQSETTTKINLNYRSEYSCDRLRKLPDTIGQLTQLEKLELSGNNLIELPNSIKQLTELKKLDLSFNNLERLPEWIGRLTRIKKLYLQHNSLKKLPESIHHLDQLEKLDLWCNDLTELPESIGQLTRLERLELEGNNLIRLPESICSLNLLERLYVGNNQLVEVPESIGELTRLKRMKLRGNDLTELPESVGGLSNLTELDLQDNPLSKRAVSRLRSQLPNVDIKI